MAKDINLARGDAVYSDESTIAKMQTCIVLAHLGGTMVCGALQLMPLHVVVADSGAGFLNKEAMLDKLACVFQKSTSPAAKEFCMSFN